MNIHRTAFAISAGLLVSLAVAACGNSDDNSTSTEAEAPTTSAAAPTSTAEVKLGDTGLGSVLVGGDGHTLYLFESDTSGDASTCSAECAAAWPPLTTKGKPQAGSGVDASMLTTFKRDDGTSQIAYNGHPLYFYAEDTAPGDTNGNESDEFGAEWYAMTAAGESVGDDEGEDSSDDDSSSAPSSGEAASGSSY